MLKATGERWWRGTATGTHRVLGQVRSTQRRERYPPGDEPRLLRRMVELATEYGRYGYRRIAAMLGEEGWKVNHKRVERLWKLGG